MIFLVYFFSCIVFAWFFRSFCFVVRLLAVFRQAFDQLASGSIPFLSIDMEYDQKSLSAKSVSQLREILSDLGLETSGNKAILIRRVLDHVKAVKERKVEEERKALEERKKEEEKEQRKKDKKKRKREAETAELEELKRAKEIVKKHKDKKRKKHKKKKKDEVLAGESSSSDSGTDGSDSESDSSSDDESHRERQVADVKNQQSGNLVALAESLLSGKSKALKAVKRLKYVDLKVFAITTRSIRSIRGAGLRVEVSNVGHDSSNSLSYAEWASAFLLYQAYVLSIRPELLAGYMYHHRKVTELTLTTGWYNCGRIYDEMVRKRCGGFIVPGLDTEAHSFAVVCAREANRKNSGNRGGGQSADVPICKKFNGSGCSLAQCRYQHVCMNCRSASHTASACSSPTIKKK